MFTHAAIFLAVIGAALIAWGWIGMSSSKSADEALGGVFPLALGIVALVIAAFLGLGLLIWAAAT